MTIIAEVGNRAKHTLFEYEKAHPRICEGALVTSGAAQLSE
jgi:hypothetical protein